MNIENAQKEMEDKKTKEIFNMQAVEALCQATSQAVIGRLVAPATQKINAKIQKLLLTKLKDGFIDFSSIKLSDIEEITVNEIKAIGESL